MSLVHRSLLRTPGLPPKVALRTLKRLSASPDPRAASAIAGWIGDADEDVHTAAIEALSACGLRAVPQLLELTGVPEPRRRTAAVTVLGMIGPNHEVISHALLTTTVDSHARVRAAAMKALGRARAEFASAALDALTRGAQDESPAVVVSACESLKQFPSLSPELLQILLRLLEDPRATVRQSAAVLVGRAASHDRELREDLRDRSSRRHSSEQSAALAALAECVQPEDEQLLLELIPSGHRDVRLAALACLTRLSSVGEQALHTIARLLQHQDWRTRVSAVLCLGAQGRRASRFLPAFVHAFEDSSGPVRLAALQAVTALKASATSAWPFAVRRFDDLQPPVRHAAARTVAMLCWDHRDSLPLLDACLQHPSPPVRAAAVECLSHFGPRDESISNRLVAALRDSDPRIKHAAITSLVQMSRHEPRVAQQLRDLVRYDAETATAALRVLSQAGQAL